MTKLKMGELFAGYGGLGMGVAEVLNVELAWVSEFDKGPSKILAHCFPDVPNHGDITKINWSQVEPVDVLTGGSPCQDLSHAGKRAGMTEGTRSNLWVAMREAIAQLRPSLVIWENVGGAFSAAADSEVEPCAGCVGDGSGTHMRALGRVLGDLATLGYDARWVALRAADVGAPHGRLRVFVVAYPAAYAGRLAGEVSPTRGLTAVTQPACDGDPRGTGLTLMPTPRATDGTKGGPNQRGSSGDLMLPSAVHRLLSTPAVNDMGASYTPEEWDAWTDRMKVEHCNGNGHGKSLHIEAARLLPTPTTEPDTGNGHARNLGKEARLIPTPSVADSTGGHERRGGARGDELLLKGMAKEGHLERWGQYAAAIQRWESLTRPASAPTETGPKGNPRLSAAFSEWMMGLPAGWVTDVPGITRNEALKALGNGVVPQQCAAALRWLLTVNEVAA